MSVDLFLCSTHVAPTWASPIAPILVFVFLVPWRLTFFDVWPRLCTLPLSGTYMVHVKGITSAQGVERVYWVVMMGGALIGLHAHVLIDP